VKFVIPFEPSSRPRVLITARRLSVLSRTVHSPFIHHTIHTPFVHPVSVHSLPTEFCLPGYHLSGYHTPSIHPVSVQRSQPAHGRRCGPLHRLRPAYPLRRRWLRARRLSMGGKSEKSVRLAQKMQVGPCIPVGIRLQKAEVGPTSGPTWCLSDYKSHFTMHPAYFIRDVTHTKQTGAAYK
jgi:hypothetical protein